MKLTTVFLLLISCALGFEQESCYLSAEEEDQCASVCYPIVKPLMRYFEVCQTKDRTNAELQKQLSEVQNQLNKVNLKYSELLEKHLASQDKCTDVALKYAEIQEKFQQTHQELRKSQESLPETTLKYEQVQDQLPKVNIENEEMRKKDLPETQITEKSDQIKQVDDYIFDLESSSELELEEMRNRFLQESIEEASLKIYGIKKSEQEKHQSNSETPIKGPVLPDRCPLKQDSDYSYPDIQIPGFEPFMVCCISNTIIGSGWMEVFYKYERNYAKEFNRTYEEYINGVVRDFLGLEKLHFLTNWKSHEVHINVWDDETNWRLTCANFVVGDKSEGYSIKKLDGCTRDTSNIHLIQGTKFSTFDRDEDGNPNHHWAKEFGYGWWFNSRLEFNNAYKSFYMAIKRKD